MPPMPAPHGIKPMDTILRGCDVGPHDEDCLYLNVWTPGLDDARRPVLFWIHGGGWEYGSGAQPTYDGRRLAEGGDAVVVTINYRLGALGFLNLNEVTNGAIPAGGNNGRLDQVAALEWVQENIAAFGGDPDRVLIFGQSAGSADCAFHLASPRSAGLFHRAILESNGGHTAQPLSRAAWLGEMFLQDLGIDPSDADAIRDLPVDRIIETSMALTPRAGSPDATTMRYHPVIDGRDLHDLPIEALRKGASSAVPVLGGSNLDEYRLAMANPPELTDEGVLAYLRTYVPEEYVDQVVAGYQDLPEGHRMLRTPADLMCATAADRVVRMPMIKLAEAKRNHRAPGYHYLFTWPAPIFDGRLGAPHALELGFVFGTHDATFSGSGPEADALSATIQDAWLNFARTGNPSGDLIGEWPAYGSDRATMILGAECRVERAPHEEERLIWEPLPESVLGSI